MYRVLNTDNAPNTLTVQGAFSHNSNSDICRILFQNYDADSAKTYDMATIGMQDQWGSSNLNGYGNITFKTNADGSKTLHERMRIQYDGKVGIGTIHPKDDLEINGNILSNNLIKKTSSNSISLCWDQTPDICFETQQYISSNNVKGTRTQRHTLNTNTLNIESDTTTGTGNIDAYRSLNIVFDIQSSNVVTVSSHSTFNVAHTLTVNVLSTTGNVWLI